MFLACLLTGAKVVHTPETIEFYREGDVGKITESKTGRSRRLHEWARFLIKARAACLAKGIDPVNWFGFRRRVWEADEDLSRLADADPCLREQLSFRMAGEHRLHFTFGTVNWSAGGADCKFV